MDKIGILCGLKSEAKIADRIPDVLVGCSAARPERARALAERMAQEGVTRLISFGLAGAVSPELVAGDLLLGVSVMTMKGSWEVDATWNKPFIDQLPHALCVALWGSDRPALTAKDKELIYRRTGCMAVDMESHVVAETAQEYGIPFNIVRAVSDGAAVDLPSAAQLPLLEDGGIDLRGIYESVKKNRQQLPELLHLGVNAFKAMRALKQAIRIMRMQER